MGKKKQKAINYGRGDFGGPSGHCRVSSPRGGHSDGRRRASGQTFSEALRVAGLSLRSIVADGNCLFRAAADQLYGDQNLHKKVRESAVSYMRSNEAEFACFTDTEEEPFPSYVRRMAREGTWGGQLELQAISLAHKVNLLIYVAPEDLWGSKVGGGAVHGALQGAPKGKAATGAEGRRPVGGPCWDIWKMQNFGPSAICLQLAFHSAMQHYSSVRLLGGQMGAPSSLTLAQLEAHSNQWTKAAPHTPQGPFRGAPEEDDTHILEGPQQEQSNREGGGPPDALQPNSNSNDGSNSSSSNNSSSSSNNNSSSSRLEKEALLRSLCLAAAADLSVDCPLCLSCRRDAWRTGALAAQVHALGPLGAPPALLSSSPSAAPSIAAAEPSKVSDAAAAAALAAPAAAAAEGAPTPLEGPSPIRPRGRSCLAKFWRCGRQPPGAFEGPCSLRRLSSSNSSSSNSSSSNSSSSNSSSSNSNSSSSVGREAGRISSGSPWSVGAPIRKAFFVPLRPPLGSNEAEVYKHRNLPGSSSSRSSSSSTAAAAAVLEGLFSIDSETLMPNNSQPPAAAARAAAAAATAAPSSSPKKGSRYSAAAGAAAAAAAAASAEVAAADAATNVLAPLEVPMPCMAWGGPGLLRVEVPSPLCISSSSSSSSRRALSLPSLRIRLLPCARLWLTGEAAAAAAAMGAPCLSIPPGEARGPPANVQTGGAPAGSPGCKEDADDTSAAAAQQQQQQQQQPRCKGRLSKREKNELKKEKKLQRELYRAERRREAAKSSSVGPSKDGGRGLSGEEGGPPESVGSIKKLAELTSRLLAV